MYERTRSPSSGYNAGTGYTNTASKMASDIGPRKTMFVLVVVVGCFAILWPKVFYPMLVGSANQHIKPSPIDKTTGNRDRLRRFPDKCKQFINKIFYLLLVLNIDSTTHRRWSKN